MMRSSGPGSVSAQGRKPERAAGDLSAELVAVIRREIDAAGGWLPFDRYMALALYRPGLGYYANAGRKFGRMPASGSDFVTAPELSPLFGESLAKQVAQALAGTGTREVWEFGAGSGVLAADLLEALDALGAPCRYTIVELSADLRARQQARLARFGDRVRWVDALPEAIEGVVVGNELLDAIPVRLVAFDGSAWHERGVVVAREGASVDFDWADRPTDARPPVDGPFAAGTVTELHDQAEAFVATLAERLTRGAAFFVDYGFPAAEYYHPQRTGGTLMCHRAHRADADPLVEVGLKDITAHVDFTGIALAGQAAGLEVLGYTTQAHFLLNCGIGDRLEQATLPERANAQKLLTEHEMGELFKVIGFVAKGADPAFMSAPLGFARGDRTHRL